MIFPQRTISELANYTDHKPLEDIVASWYSLVFIRSSSVYRSRWRLVYNYNNCSVPENTSLLQDLFDRMRNLHKTGRYLQKAVQSLLQQLQHILLHKHQYKIHISRVYQAKRLFSCKRFCPHTCFVVLYFSKMAASKFVVKSKYFSIIMHLILTL